MILSQMTLWDFRKFFSKSHGQPGVLVHFHKGLNALIGENDAGKSAIIDAIKIVLQTQSGEFIRICDDDFYISPEGKRATEFKISCVFEDFKINEAKNFIEWLTYTKNSSTGIVSYTLSLHFKAWRENGRIFTELKAGRGDDGVVLDGKARELLKVVYLRPLRDAAKEMHSGRNSRISQILYNHPLFRGKEDNALVRLFSEANEAIKKYFCDEDGKEILGRIQEILREFIEADGSKDASLKTSEMRLKSILESLSLVAPEVSPGLGMHNLLFIAAELLLLSRDENGGLRLALVEELEAHLHPQAQLRLINYLQKEYNDSGVQVIISTHSVILASKINVKNIILLNNANAYDLSPGQTQLEKGDYLFLQRFLDATKSNLFFAKGIIMVEGDAENLLIPALADILGLNLEKHGVSMVNVGNIGFFRYARIFMRKNGGTIGIPISIVTDCDVIPEKNTNGINSKKDETSSAIKEIESSYNHGNIKAFVSPYWTFEYSVALSVLREMLYKSILEAKKIENSDKYALTQEKIEGICSEVQTKVEEWQDLPEHDIAYKIYHDIMLNKEQKESGTKTTSKAIVAQCFASNLRWAIVKTDVNPSLTEDKKFDLNLYQLNVNEKQRETLKGKIEKDQDLLYLVNAIRHATGTMC